MKKIAIILILALISGFSAEAYNASALPLYLTFSEASGISSSADINSAQVININEAKTVNLKVSQIRELYTLLKDIKMKRCINPTPFSGIVMSITTADSVIGFYTNSGIQIGKYGENNYICYVPEEPTEAIAKIRSIYYDSTGKKEMTMFPVNEGVDFLKLPAEQWAVDSIKNAAAKSLLPYSLTENYSKNITREEFCIIMGNMIAVHANYKSVEDYMRDNKTVYQKNFFTDCENADPSVGILHTLGIVNGKSENTFEPDAPIAREEAAKMIAASAELFMPLSASKDVSFKDKKQISNWATFYVKWCNEKGIMKGDDKNNFSPKANFTVTEAIITVGRLFDLLQTI